MQRPSPQQQAGSPPLRLPGVLSPRPSPLRSVLRGSGAGAPPLAALPLLLPARFLARPCLTFLPALSGASSFLPSSGGPTTPAPVGALLAGVRVVLALAARVVRLREQHAAAGARRGDHLAVGHARTVTHIGCRDKRFVTPRPPLRSDRHAPALRSVRNARQALRSAGHTGCGVTIHARHLGVSCYPPVRLDHGGCLPPRFCRMTGDRAAHMVWCDRVGHYRRVELHAQQWHVYLRTGNCPGQLGPGASCAGACPSTESPIPATTES